MMKRAAIILLIIAFTASLAIASDSGDSWWSKLKSKIEKVTPKKTPTTTTSVGGVRGAKETPNDLYWKGKDEKLSISEEELSKFMVALDYAMNGERYVSMKHFEDFLNTYPESALAGDAKLALEKLKTD